MTTALTGTAAVRAAGTPRLTRWVLRLHRPALYAWAALVIALAALLLGLHGPLADAAAEGWRQYEACTGTARCAYDQEAILRYKDYRTYATLTLNALPLLVAGWAGAALVGRELESGTALLAWTQGTSPARWLAVRLAVPAVAVAAGTALLCRLHHLAWSAGRGRIDTAEDWYDRLTFYANGPTAVVLALAGLALGALAGLLLRRTLPALLVALVAVAALRGLLELALPHLWPAVTSVSTPDKGYAGSGLGVDQGVVTRSGARVPLPDCTGEAPCRAAYADVTGYWHTYHPYSHYRPLQFVSCALLLAVTGLLVLGSFALLRRATGTARTARRTAA
ncbi:ABC transporter permease [Streptomyces sp. SID161]|uniref:ABC transporter permease n=1 Tax=unclassified Streptomyces TaxID=2593676 RepID=UPI001368BE1C|nr:ABC transporter permease [Streptomyces sp. SID161]MYW42013.1 ABC transporter permease [Streptomyces sp. SID161]